MATELDLNDFMRSIPPQTTYQDSGYDVYFDRNLFFPAGNSIQTSAADLMNSAEGFIGGGVSIDLVRGGIFVKDDQGVERVVIGNFNK